MKLKINAQKMLSIMISVFIVTSISATMFAAAAENSNNPHTDINCSNIVQESLSSQPEDNTDFSLYNSFYISTMDDLKTQVTAAADGIPVELIIDNSVYRTNCHSKKCRHYLER